MIPDARDILYRFSATPDGRRQVVIARTYRHDVLVDREDMIARMYGVEIGPVVAVGGGFQCVVTFPGDV